MNMGMKDKISSVQGGLGQKVGRIKDLGLLFTGVFSTDRPTARMSTFFILCLSGLIVLSSSVGILHWMRNRRVLQQEAREREAELLEEALRDSEESEVRESFVSLGRFLIELHHGAVVPKQKAAPSVVNMAEVEITLFCDGKQTRAFIEDNRIQVRNQISNVLTAMDRQELMSHEGKRKLQSAIMRQVNSWLPRGRVEEVYFAKLAID